MKHRVVFEIERYPAGFGFAINLFNVRDEWDFTARERRKYGLGDLPFPLPKPKARLGKQSHLKALPDDAGQDEDEDEVDNHEEG